MAAKVIPTYYCQCGCGEVIPPKPSHRTRPPKYIQSHYLKMGTSKRIERLREAKKKERLQPPEGWNPPSGFCECGCDERTKIAKFSRPERGEYIGYPRRYLSGHNMRDKRGKHHPQWEGGRFADQQGYVLVHMPDYPSARKDGYIFEHRYVYEQSRGVRLPKDVIVHHINGVRDDNRPENLMATIRQRHDRVHLRAGAVISLFLDDRLLETAKVYVREHGQLPDIAKMTNELYAADKASEHDKAPSG